MQLKDKYNINDLLEIMKILRAQCPWDKQQTHKTIRNNFIEETYEAVEAIDTDDYELLKEELGDVLLQVIFHSQMASEKDIFDFNDVCNDIVKKLIERHPHIFGDVKVNSTEDVLNNWNEIKKKQKGQETATKNLQSVSRSLPALMRSEKVQDRARKAGFDYPNVSMALDDLKSEIIELENAMKDNSNIEEEIGDVLFSAVNVSRMLSKNPEEALTKSCDKFISRFSFVENQGVNLKEADIDLLNELWQKSKMNSRGN